jgi:hypothetical protein
MNGAACTNSSDRIQKMVSSGELRNVVRCSAHRSDGAKLRYTNPAARNTTVKKTNCVSNPEFEGRKEKETTPTLDPIAAINKHVRHELIHILGLRSQDQRRREDPMQKDGARGRIEGPVAGPEARPREDPFLGQLLLDARHGEGLCKHVAQRRQGDEERHHARHEGALAPDIFEETRRHHHLGVGDLFLCHGGKLQYTD